MPKESEAKLHFFLLSSALLTSLRDALAMSYGRASYNDNASYGQASGPHGRKDSTTSSFFNPAPRHSAELLNNGPATPHSQESSYYGSKPTLGAADPEMGAAGGGWDVYADFNNAGPRYSSMKTQSGPGGSVTASYMAQPHS